MELQSIIHQANQRTLSDSRPADVKQIQKPANLLTASQQSTDNAATHRSIPVRAWGQKLRLHHKAVRQLKSVHNPSFTKDQAHHRSYPRISRKRIPRVPVCYPPTFTTHKDDEQQQPPEQLADHDDAPTEESSPADTPNASPETQATDTAGASSPEPASESIQDVDLTAADIPTLQNMEKAACERVVFHQTRLISAREQLTRIRKRLKRMQDDQSSGTPQASPATDMDMEIID